MRRAACVVAIATGTIGAGLSAAPAQAASTATTATVTDVAGITEPVIGIVRGVDLNEIVYGLGLQGLLGTPPKHGVVTPHHGTVLVPVLGLL